MGGAGEKALFGDLGVKDISKAYAIDILLKHMHADIKDSIAFGDAKIDIPMLQYCNIGVAMGSGGQECNAVADNVTDDVDKCGLNKATKHLELIKNEIDEEDYLKFSRNDIKIVILLFIRLMSLSYQKAEISEIQKLVLSRMCLGTTSDGK